MACQDDHTLWHFDEFSSTPPRVKESRSHKHTCLSLRLATPFRDEIQKE
jgi:hypothetical protein